MCHRRYGMPTSAHGERADSVPSQENFKLRLPTYRSRWQALGMWPLWVCGLFDTIHLLRCHFEVVRLEVTSKRFVSRDGSRRNVCGGALQYCACGIDLDVRRHIDPACWQCLYSSRIDPLQEFLCVGVSEPFCEHE